MIRQVSQGNLNPTLGVGATEQHAAMQPPVLNWQPRRSARQSARTRLEGAPPRYPHDDQCDAGKYAAAAQQPEHAAATDERSEVGGPRWPAELASHSRAPPGAGYERTPPLFFKAEHARGKQRVLLTSTLLFVPPLLLLLLLLLP